MPSKNARPLLKIVLGLFVAAGLLSASLSCQRNGNGTNGQESTTTYTIADATGDWGYPTPYGMYPRGPGYIRMSFIFDTLIWKNKDGELTGALAEKWSYDEKQKTYTFSLRKDLKWHDGHPLTARDVVFTFQYMQNHPWPWMKSGLIRDVRTTDDSTVEIVLTNPYAPFPTNIAGTVPILPEHIWKTVEDPKKFRGEKAVIGSGPYRLSDYSPSHGTYLYLAWDDYYLGKPKFDRIQFVKYSEEITPTALRTGKVDAGGVPPETVNDLKKDGVTVASQPPVWAAKLMFNRKKAPFSHAKFRRAVAYAIDRKRLTKIVRRGHGIPGSPGLLPPSNEFWHNPDTPKYEYDPPQAQKLLRQLGYERGENQFFRKDGNVLQVELLVAPGRQEFGRTAEVMKRQLESVGIRVEIRGMEAKTLDAMLKQWHFEIALSGHGGLGGDPEILNKMTLGTSFNSARYRQNKRLVEKLQEQLRQVDRTKRQKLVYDIQKLYARDLPALTLYHPTWYWAHNEKTNIAYTPGGLAAGIPIPLNKIFFVSDREK
ncbi:MAG: ABC transporter substrate-binding protein [Candidatus Brocadiia bacterium]